MIKWVVAILAVMVFVFYAQVGQAHWNNGTEVTVLSEHDIFETVEITEEVTTCTKGDDKTTEGAIVGGVIGAQEGNAGLGAIIGAIIGDAIGEETCKTETKVVGTEQVYSHTNVVIEIYGQKIFIAVKKDG